MLALDKPTSQKPAGAASPGPRASWVTSFACHQPCPLLPNTRPPYLGECRGPVAEARDNAHLGQAHLPKTRWVASTAPWASWVTSPVAGQRAPGTLPARFQFLFGAPSARLRRIAIAATLASEQITAATPLATNKDSVGQRHLSPRNSPGCIADTAGVADGQPDGPATPAAGRS